MESKTKILMKMQCKSVRTVIVDISGVVLKKQLTEAVKLFVVSDLFSAKLFDASLANIKDLE